MTRSPDPRRKRRLYIVLATLAISSAALGLPLVLVSPADATTTCIKMPCGGAGSTKRSVSNNHDGFPAKAPDFSGSFRIAYTPIMCFKAPCPPGSYSIRASGGSPFAARVRRVILRTADGGAAETFEGRYIGGRSFTLKGEVWIEDQTAYVSMRRALDDQ